MLHPALVLFAGGLRRCRFARRACASALVLLAPARRALAPSGSLPDGAALDRRLPRLPSSSRRAATCSPPLRDGLRDHGASRAAVRAEPAAAASELSGAFLRRRARIGVCFAGDLVTLFVFWELMAIGSTAHPLERRSGPPIGPSCAISMVHLLGGVLLMAGIAGARRGNGLRHVRGDAARLPGALADPGGIPRERRRAPALGLDRPTPIPKRRGAARSSFPLSRRRRRSTCCCAAFRARSP